MKVLRVVDKVSEWTGRVVSFLMIPLILFVVYDVLMRYAFRKPTEWAFEASYFMFGTLWVIGGAFALQQRAHVQMEVFYNRLSIRGRAILDLATAPLFFLFAGVLLWASLNFARASWLGREHSNSMWGPPIYPMKTLIPVGAFLILAQGSAKLIRDVFAAVTGRTAP